MEIYPETAARIQRSLPSWLRRKNRKRNDVFINSLGPGCLSGLTKSLKDAGPFSRVWYLPFDRLDLHIGEGHPILDGN